MKATIVLAAGVLAALALGSPALAGSATGTVNLQSINGSGASQTFTYGINLTNTGTTAIGTFWYAWLPPDNVYDFLISRPTAVSDPAGWTHVVLGSNNGRDDTSIRWVNTTTPLAPGNSLTFSFTTLDNFATVTGNSYSGYPVGYSYISTGAPETDPGALVNIAPGVSTIPEPASLSLLLCAAPLLLGRRTLRT